MSKPQEIEAANTTKLRSASVLLSVAGCAIIAIIIIWMYSYTATLLKNRLTEHVMGVVGTAANLLNNEEVNYLVQIGAQTGIKSREYSHLIQKLRSIKEVNPDITFAYVLSQTKNPGEMRFVADADVLALRPDLNFNIDVESNEVVVTGEGFPGAIYDVSEIGVIVDGSASLRPVVNPEIYQDIWGTLYSGYAPIKDSQGNTVAILAVDFDITGYNYLVKTTFLPFGLVTVGLSVLIFILTIGFLKLWGTRVELLKQLDRQKDELISIVSHQLATPITSLKWNVEILLDGDTGPLNEQQKKELQVMQSSTNNLADLVSMMLDVSRLELGRMKVDRTDVDVRKLFEETIEMVRPKALEKKQTLEVVLGEMPTARLDKRLTRMTLENLLTNAIKYTPDRGKVIVTAQVNKDVLHYQVRDTGFGIPKKEQSQIFGKLFRASNVQTVPGNGLGLFAAKGAVEAQCGRIHFESSPGWGTVFTVDLPLTEEASLPASPKKKGCLSWRTRAR